jgi:glycerol transport system substrate-binding protein
MKLRKLKLAVAVGISVSLSSISISVYAQTAIKTVQNLIETEFSPSTLTKQQQLDELEWFVEAAKPFKGMSINVASETIATHTYESQVLAKAFTELTGIIITHDLIQEGDVIEKLQTQMQSGRNIYDAYINDSDLIGTHFRYGKVVAISDMIVNEAKDYTLPTLDIDDFILQQVQTVKSISYRHNNLPIYIGFVPIGLNAKT